MTLDEIVRTDFTTIQLSHQQYNSLIEFMKTNIRHILAKSKNDINQLNNKIKELDSIISQLHNIVEHQQNQIINLTHRKLTWKERFKGILMKSETF